MVLVEDGRGDTVSFELADELVVAPGSEAFRLITDVGWWETQPPTDLSEYSQMRLRFTFENTADFDMTFLGDEEPDGLEAELQVWTRPDLYETPTVHFDAYPKGTFAPGESFSWELTVELNELTTPQTSIAIRPAQKERGSGLPAYRGWLTLVASELTLIK